MRGPWPLYLLPILVPSIAGPAFADPAVAPAPRYEAAIKQLDRRIAREVSNKQLPALSIALVDHQTVVWAKGYGFADAATNKSATADTVYRVGSLAKLFTDIAVLQLVERNSLDLDAPVSKYLPDFHPVDPFGKAVTLRNLMAHRSGLVREPPAGSYFDPAPPSLASTVASLNKTTLVYEPGTRFKYSNASVATVGRVLEATQNVPFSRYVSRSLLKPLGMNSSSFDPEWAAQQEVAKGLMWTEHGREFPAPTFAPGIAPACGMYSSASDLARFLCMLLGGGKTAAGQIVRPETLEQMWTAQFAKPGTKRGMGNGFIVGELEGHRLIGHDAAVYGFAARLAVLPDDRLGAVVLTSRDCANAVTEQIANEALMHLLSVKQNKPLPNDDTPTALKPGRARALAGRWKTGAKTLDLEEFAGRLWMLAGQGGSRAELRSVGDVLVTDDSINRGLLIEPSGDRLKVGVDTFERIPEQKPGEAPAKWRGLIGEYGWDHQTLYILEKNGKLHALIGWFFHYPLEEESADVYRFPDRGMFAGEKVVFSRDRSGRATRAVAGGVAFERRKLDGENGETFRIKTIRPLAELRREARAATPPPEKGDFRKPELVDLTALDPGIKLDVRYATDNNFLSTPFYTSAQAFMQRPAAEAVARVHRGLAASGYGLLIFDGYRPWSVTKMFWEATPEKQRIFVADPSKGSRHNRGCAVDLTLYDLKTGKPVEMVGGYDEMSDRSYPQYPGGTSLQRWHRELLRHAMEAEGFTVYEAEWWHFDYKDWQRYSIGNKTFEELAAPKP
jgi:CubicO group peptidase (beta-lactamase class C family)/D-alanyl-D-alanine dipeptidase